MAHFTITFTLAVLTHPAAYYAKSDHRSTQEPSSYAIGLLQWLPKKAGRVDQRSPRNRLRYLPPLNEIGDTWR
jgi:hypothetical protein